MMKQVSVAMVKIMKVQAGYYLYKGFEIIKKENADGFGVWRISEKTTENWVEDTMTLKDAVIYIADNCKQEGN